MEGLERRVFLAANPSLLDADIGSPGMAGSASFNGTTWTVRGGGSDIWNTSDQFNFASTGFSGDGLVIARVASETNTSPWAKAGVMIRSDTSASAAFADVVLTQANSVSFQWRSAAGAAANAVYATGIVSAPIWVKLDRAGNQFGASYSYDGANWIQIGDKQSVAINPSAQAGLAVTAVNNAALNTATFTRVGILPLGWMDNDIGSPGITGTAAFDGGNWTVQGSGADIYNASDQFNFANQTFVGDVSIVAKVTSISNTGTYAKAGVMIRDGTAASASYAFMFVNPNNGIAGEGANFEYRNGAGAPAQSAASAAGVSAPQWVKLVRIGNTFTAYYSGDGNTWKQNGLAQVIAMGATINVGLAVDANTNAALNTATFSNVSVLPAGWADGDIGAPLASGSAFADGLNWTLNGGGSDIWGTADQFNFASQSYTGDATIVARVDSILSTGAFVKAGIMMRESAAAGARYAYLFLTPTQISFEYRSSTGGAAQGAGIISSTAAAMWLKMVRSGGTYTAFYSVDDQTWVQLGGAASIAMNPTIRVGLAVDANSASALNSATFSNVQVGARIVDPFLKANGQDFRNGHGTGDDVNLRGTNLGGWLLLEPWLNTVDGSGLTTDIEVWNTLESRFGAAPANRLMAAFQDNWITTLDLDNVRAMGLNVLRVPFGYRVLVDSAGNWRPDAFTKLDWVVNEAFKRGIYTVLDFHGLPGGDSSFDSSGTKNGGAFWTNTANQDLANTIWSRVAQHFAGNPGVAAYDLLNEPVPPNTSTLWNVYNRFYQTVRAADPGHIVMMEGGGIGNSYWNLDTLPNPADMGWTNVAYQVHAYATGGGAAGQGVANQKVQEFHDRAYYNVPDFIGEFNLGDQTDYGVQLWNANNLNWSSWTYKMTESPGGGWGVYDVTGTWPTRPNVQTDSLAAILSAYATANTAGRWGANPNLRHIVGQPTSVADAYATTSGNALYVPPAAGVLVNNVDPNLGQPGISLSASLVDGVSHGSLTLWPDGSFSYTPAAGFVGTDTFRYRTLDGHNDSTNIAVVSILVRAAAVDHHLFYNHSYFSDPAHGFTSDNAIDTSKSALIDGGVATFANYGGSWLGINGIMVDIAGLIGTVGAGDFTFKMGNDNAPGAWAAAPLPTVTVRKGMGLGGSDRVELVWADHQIENTWLQVMVKANTATGLGTPDVFYFGNAVGETGNNPLNASVNSGDIIAVRDHPTSSQNPALVSNPYDLNHDSSVNSTDMIIARDHPSSSSTELKLIAPASGAAAAASTLTTGVTPAHTATLANLPRVQAAQTFVAPPSTLPPLARSAKRKWWDRNAEELLRASR